MVLNLLYVDLFFNSWWYLDESRPAAAQDNRSMASSVVQDLGPGPWPWVGCFFCPAKYRIHVDSNHTNMGFIWCHMVLSSSAGDRSQLEFYLSHQYGDTEADRLWQREGLDHKQNSGRYTQHLPEDIEFLEGNRSEFGSMINSWSTSMELYTVYMYINIT